MPCIELDEQPAPKKEIACSRSFGRPVNELPDLEQAVTTFSCMAAQKLRKQQSHTAHVLVFIHTSPYRQGPTVRTHRPTSDTGTHCQSGIDRTAQDLPPRLPIHQGQCHVAGPTQRTPATG
ncbi:hypothetical protein [Simplicispira suum]|uniref:DinB/UmuC family translesion DNA polymerase n=1 Tax=Simplicispira suum TaxID=2109915 RepID=UPI001FE31946|nr:hypothetical protein [Simplicispira suum]